MALNLLQSCVRALDDISGFSIPSYICGNTNDETARTLLSAAFKVGEELARDYDWQELNKTATVTTVADTALYSMPSDMERIASDTMWDTGRGQRMYGAKTKRAWAYITNAIGASNNRYRWRLHGGFIQIDPAPTSVFSFTYEYCSSTYCTSSSGAERLSGWTDDTDIPKLPADLFIAGIRYYFSDSKTLPRASLAGAEFDAIVKSRQGKNKPAEAISYAASVRAPGGGCGGGMYGSSNEAAVVVEGDGFELEDGSGLLLLEE